MTKDDILQNLRKDPIFVATVDEGKPSLRPFEPAILYEEHIYLLTSNTKNVYHQLKANPNIEIVNMLNDEKWQRLSAQVEFDDRPEIMEAFIKDYTWVENHHKPNDGYSVALKLTNPKVRIYGDGEVKEVSL